MDNQDSKLNRDYGSSRKRHWPPPSVPEPPSPQPASTLRRRQTWQPQVWNKVHFLGMLLAQLKSQESAR